LCAVHSERHPVSSDDILDDYYTRPQLAAVLHKSERTLKRWDDERVGPPITYNGRDSLYRKASTHDWMRAKEQTRDRRRRRS
jgi:hypothetical protein